MASSLNKLKNLPLHFQVLIAVVPSVILIALFIFLIYMPKHKEMKAINVKITKLNNEISVGESKLKRLDELKAENALLKEKLEKLKQQLPEEREVSVLLKQISELGLQSGLEILLWKPEARRTDPNGLYVEIPVKVDVIAEYHRLGDFYSQISRLPRLVNISNIKLGTDKKGKAAAGKMKASFTARTFASIKAEEAAELANTAAKGKKKPRTKKK